MAQISAQHAGIHADTGFVRHWFEWEGFFREAPRDLFAMSGAKLALRIHNEVYNRFTHKKHLHILELQLYCMMTRWPQSRTNKDCSPGVEARISPGASIYKFPSLSSFDSSVWSIRQLVSCCGSPSFLNMCEIAQPQAFPSLREKTTTSENHSLPTNGKCRGV